MRTHTGETIELDEVPSDTIGCIKKKIQKQVNLPLDQIHLFFKGKPLDDDHSLADYDVQNEGTLFMKVGHLMRIHVQTETDQVLDLDVVPSDKISDIKEQVQEMEGIDMVTQQLYFDDEILEDQSTLEECGIEPEATLKLRLGERMTIFVKQRSGKLIELDVLSTDTIAAVKAKV